MTASKLEPLDQFEAFDYGKKIEWSKGQLESLRHSIESMQAGDPKKRLTDGFSDEDWEQAKKQTRGLQARLAPTPMFVSQETPALTERERCSELRNALEAFVACPSQASNNEVHDRMSRYHEAWLAGRVRVHVTP